MNVYCQKEKSLLLLPGLAFFVFILYSSALSNDFVNYDDNAYVTANDAVRSGLNFHSIMWAFKSFYSGNWHPLTWMSHMLDVQLFGLNPVGHHLTSVLLHIANTLLLYALLRKTTGALWQSLCVALLFAVHPLHVESVAWVAERKDVLCTFFGMLTMLAYVSYTKTPGPVRYMLVVALLLCGLMAKPMLVTLPFVLLLLDIWPLGRLNFKAEPSGGVESKIASVSLPKLFLEKAPLFALALTSCAITLAAQQKGGAVVPFEQSPFLLNLGNAVIAYATYVLKTFWPSDLAVFYPFDAAAVTPWRVAGAGLFMIAMTFLAVRARRHRPYLAVGWLWFVGTLVPVIGLVRVGGQSMADRYTYLPLIGLFIALVWGISELSAHYCLTTSCAIIVLSALSVVSWAQLQYWRNSITLFEHTLKVSGSTWLAHNNLGLALKERGRYDEALDHLLETLRLRPDFAPNYNNIGNTYQMLGQTQKAVEFLKEAINKDPNYLVPHFNLGLAYSESGRKDLALTEYRFLTEADPKLAEELHRIIQSN